MKEFKSFCSYADDKLNIANALEVAGICEVYQTGDWQNLSNYHTDFVGEYIGDSLAVIQDGDEVRWQIMDADDYNSTLLANCSGDAEDFVDEATGKVLVVQFYRSADAE